MAHAEKYNGFEQGPIRPPSEANSLLIRVTRNCPWNRCRFCPVYKNQKFSRRPLDHVLKDIDKVSKILDEILKLAGDSPVTREVVVEAGKDLKGNDIDALHAALHWVSGGMESVFLQDANSLIVKPDELITILNHLKGKFPFIKRITSYARSATIAKISDDDLKKIADAGLNRIHIGMESGSDNVLKFVEKGATKEIHVIAGKKVKKAGMSLSEYVMPGLGGSLYSRDHAVETADALNQINPDFIRIRTLAIPNITPLYDDYMEKKFDKLTDIESARELRQFIEKLDPGLNSVITSDHVLNLFEDVEGRVSSNKDLMLEKIDSFFSLSDYDKMIYQVGRRLGLFRGVLDMKDQSRYDRAKEMALKFDVTPENADFVIAELMKRFI